MLGLIAEPLISVGGFSVGRLRVLRYKAKILRVAYSVSLVNDWNISVGIQLGNIPIELIEIGVSLAIESDDSVPRQKAETRCCTIRLQILDDESVCFI